jgi:hypothetical protein
MKQIIYSLRVSLPPPPTKNSGCAPGVTSQQHSNINIYRCENLTSHIDQRYLSVATSLERAYCVTDYTELAMVFCKTL